LDPTPSEAWIFFWQQPPEQLSAMEILPEMSKVFTQSLVHWVV
jgi:hypothetical protein